MGVFGCSALIKSGSFKVAVVSSFEDLGLEKKKTVNVMTFWHRGVLLSIGFYNDCTSTVT
jgi:hypothetical protein